MKRFIVRLVPVTMSVGINCSSWNSAIRLAELTTFPALLAAASGSPPAGHDPTINTLLPGTFDTDRLKSRRRRRILRARSVTSPRLTRHISENSRRVRYSGKLLNLNLFGSWVGD
jgi:hypothetical protein